MRYAALMQRLFEQAGVDSSSGADLAAHVEVNGTTVGLIPKDQAGLVIYVDLGHPTLTERRLLEHNASTNTPVPGGFVIVPDTGKLAYRFDVPFDLLEHNPSLPSWLLARVHQAQEALASA
jgi:hypothetical protein